MCGQHLSEFASGVHGLAAQLRDSRLGSVPPLLQLLDGDVPVGQLLSDLLQVALGQLQILLQLLCRDGARQSRSQRLSVGVSQA